MNMESDQLRNLIEESTVRHSAHVIDIVVRGGHGRTIIEAFIDSEEGITSGLCAEISREVLKEIEAREMISGSYELIVSSPGADRPLKYAWQYKKHLGRLVCVKVKGDQDIKEVTGKLAIMEPEGIVLEVGKKGENARIGFTDIEEARLKLPW